MYLIWFFLFVFFFQEINDQQLWSMICSTVIEGTSVVFKECTVKGEGLPHGNIDVVAGQIDRNGAIQWNFGVQILAENLVRKVNSPIGVSAKTQAAMPTTPLRKSSAVVRVNVHSTTHFCCIVAQVVFETLAFAEVLRNEDDRPVVFFAGMCTNKKC